MTSYIPSLTLPGFVFEQPAVAILLPIAAGTAVGFSTRPRETQDQYMALKQPSYRPPPQIFGPMWTVLYGTMGFAAYRAWTTGTQSFSPHVEDLARKGATLYTVQLGLNLIWMPLFFKFKRPIEATVDIVALTGITGYMAYLWGQVDQVAGWALAPYCGWLCFATYLCAGTGYLNGWDFSDKERAVPPSMKNKDTKYVDENDD